jgi:hypothetical protein
MTPAERREYEGTLDACHQWREGCLRLKARVREMEAQWEEHCAYHGAESPHALNDALYRASDAESHCKALAEDIAREKARANGLTATLNNVRAVAKGWADSDSPAVQRYGDAILDELTSARDPEPEDANAGADAAESREKKLEAALRALNLDPERLRMDKRIPLETKRMLADIVDTIASRQAKATNY